MINPNKLPWIFLIAILTCLAVGLFSLYIYGTQRKLPSDFTVSGWKAGGLTRVRFQEQLQQRLMLYQQQTIKLQSPDPKVASKEPTLEQMGLVVDIEELENILHGLFEGPVRQRVAARWKLRSGNFELKASFDSNKMTHTVEQAWKDLYKEQPVNAKRVISPDDEVIYEPEKPVIRIDTAKLHEQLNSLVPPFDTSLYGKGAVPLRIKLTLFYKQPAVTVKNLKQEGIQGKIMEYTTDFPSTGEGRIHNIRATAASIHDMLLQPGAIFDYSKIIQQTEAKFGYREAPVILNGKLVPGIGGGICQVSSTLYNAVLRSGMDIVERRNHSLPISYAPLGQDATYANGSINFKFRNNTGAYLLIRTSTSDRQVTVKLFGQMPSDTTYEIESTIIETLPPPVKYVNNPALPRGVQEKLSEGKKGYVVETFRTKMEKGNVVGKQLISKDRYAPQPTLIGINSGKPAPDGQEPSPQENAIIEDGVKGPIFR